MAYRRSDHGHVMEPCLDCNMAFTVFAQWSVSAVFSRTEVKALMDCITYAGDAFD